VSLHQNFAPIASGLFVEETEQEGVPYVHGAVKRLLDLAIALPALFFLLPVMLGLAILIRAGSKGPALFRQTRLGRNGTAFQILKFRTMTVLEDGPIVRQAFKHDVRVTKAGRWMRRLSLDELPQLINVVKGEMSLIGPRPHAIAHDRYYGNAIDGYDRRQSVKPGISGWAQVHGHRGATLTVSEMRERLAYDVWYARNATLALDLRIILRTFGEVLGQRNAY
jgi:lipopolysaccharide/colanic/teichoic acid biosynthesis glycosyltransferase